MLEFQLYRSINARGLRNFFSAGLQGFSVYYTFDGGEASRWV